MKTSMLHILMTLTLTFLCLTPKIFGVSPAPDGCYPNFTTAEGCNALAGLGAGAANTGIGWYSLFSVGAANYNTGLGAGALALNSADSNTAVGAAALLLNTAGTGNTAVGTGGLVYNDSGSYNTAAGYQALYSNTSGSENTAVGNSALFHNTGNFNTAIGDFAGRDLTHGYRNVCIGYSVYGVPGESYTIRIADNLPTGAGQSACYIGGIAGQTVGAGGVTCYVDNNGKLGVYLSARRYKENIQPMDEVSAALYALKPVTFRYKPEFDKSVTPQFGLIAEEVAEASPDLVTHNAKGELSTVRYEAVNVMLLNEFLKEHKAFLEEQRKVQKLEAVLGSVNQRLKEQEAKIEKVSAQIETNKPAPQIARKSQ